MRRALVGIAVALLVGGCSGVPETSSLRFGDEPGDTTGQLTRVIARPPVDGMPPIAVVRGFLDACADPSNDYSVARQYLMGATAAKWDPAAGVRVYDSSGLTIVEKSDAVTLTGRLESTISTDGLRTVVDGLPAVTETLTVGKDELGQWRIGVVPNGVLLSRSDVERSHSALAVYFLNPTLDRLVADAVVVPTSSTGLATTLVKRLLAGPSIQLGDATRTAFPSATKLTYGSVPIKSGVAYVDLSADVLAAEQPARRGLAAQLVWTLTQLPGVAAVRISVSGQLLAVPGVGVVTDTKDWKDFAPTQPATRLYSVRGANVQLMSDGASQVVSRTTEPGVRSLASVAVDPRSSRLAAVTSGGREVVANLGEKAQLKAVIKGDSMSRPTWGPLGSILAADYGRGIRAVDAAGKQLAVVVEKSTAGTEMQVKQISFASDGVRMALVFTSGSRDVLAFGAVRVVDGTARIVSVRRVESRIDAVRDVQWSGPLTVAVLGSDGSGQQVLTVGLADGKIVGVSTPVGAQTLALSGSGELYAGVVDAGRSTVMRRRFGRWSLAGTGAGPAFGP